MHIEFALNPLCERPDIMRTERMHIHFTSISGGGLNAHSGEFIRAILALDGHGLESLWIRLERLVCGLAFSVIKGSKHSFQNLKMTGHSYSYSIKKK